MSPRTLLIITQIVYLLAAVLFIIGIKKLGKTSTARSGNRLSAIAMLMAILVTLLQQDILSYVEIMTTLLVGSVIGIYVAQKVEMTKMPEMVAIFNGFGGAASMLVAVSEYFKLNAIENFVIPSVSGITISLSIIIGSITLSGSLLAYAKLSGKVSGNPVTFSGQHLLNAILFLILLTASILMVVYPGQTIYLYWVVGSAIALGVLTVLPIGGADMPVVVSLLNSYSGIAACATGFVLNNQMLIIAGALVGASGLILTQIMCKAMNRSLLNVLIGGFGQTETQTGSETTQVICKSVGSEETAMIFDAASSVIIVPGYGMAVAQAQHVVKELMDVLESKNIDIKFAIHPVAGRMPGHMNVLLAEANIPYDKLIEMEKINSAFPTTDLVMVIGANDVVNPAARDNSGSPIYGMPILNVDQAQTVIVCKRSMSAGYAGIQNELFGYPNCLMLFGDAKQSLSDVLSELKEL